MKLLGAVRADRPSNGGETAADCLEQSAVRASETTVGAPAGVAAEGD